VDETPGDSDAEMTYYIGTRVLLLLRSTSDTQVSCGLLILLM